MRSKDKFIQQTGGFRFGESPEEYQRRVSEINALRKKLMSGKGTERDQQRIYDLLGLPPDEFDTNKYDGSDDDDDRCAN